MRVTPEQVKQLRERTGAGMMDCKRALEESGGDMEVAAERLREWGLAAATRKAGRETSEGLVESYVHLGGRIGVLVEVNCETDFVARTDAFKNFAHDLAMQVAATRPLFVSRDQVPQELIERERRIYRAQAEGEKKPPQVIDRIVRGRLEKFLAEVCLVEQPYIKDPDRTVGQLLAETVASLGENIRIRRFVRFELGEALDEPGAAPAGWPIPAAAPAGGGPAG